MSAAWAGLSAKMPSDSAAMAAYALRLRTISPHRRLRSKAELRQERSAHSARTGGSRIREKRFLLPDRLTVVLAIPQHDALSAFDVLAGAVSARGGDPPALSGAVGG